MTEPSRPGLDSWSHSTNPTELRRAADGRIAMRFTLRGQDYVTTEAWLVLSAPNGLVELTHLTDEDVAGWTRLEVA